MNENGRGDQRTFTPRTRSQRIGPSGVRSSRVTRGKKQSPWKRFFNKKWLTLVAITSFLLIIGGCSALYISTMSDYIPLEELNKIDYSSILYDKKNKEFSRVGTKREPIDMKKLKEVNPDLPLAFVKVEDIRFYNHNGVDFQGLARALFVDLMCLCAKEGASTITMQVAGNVVLKDREQNFGRKFKDIIAAWAIESQIEGKNKEEKKDKILEIYLNYIGFGNGVRGVRMASKIYFGKDPMEQRLTPTEIAFLAGLPKGPNNYDPYDGNPKKIQRAIERRNEVLYDMSKTDEGLKPLITKEEFERLKKEPLGTDKQYLEKFKPDTSDYAAFEDAIAKEAKERFGIQDLRTGGYKVYTGLDRNAQNAMMEAINPDNPLLSGKKQSLEAAATMIDAETGLVKAISGGKNFKPSYINWALQRIQPGSTVKPLAVYSPVMEKDPKNFHPNIIYEDKDPGIPGWKVKNYSGGPAGLVSLREALARSLNMTPARILNENVGVETAAKTLTKLGIKLEKGDKNLAPLALGGFTRGISTKDLVQAYSVYPNMGKVKQVRFIKEIRNSNGEPIPQLEKDTYKEKMDKNGNQLDEDGEVKQVFSPRTAWWSILMMREVFDNPKGTGHSVNIPELDIAGKSGTTQGYEAGWMVGFTSDTVLAVTVFNTKGKNEKIEVNDKEPHKIWRQIMVKAGIKSPDMKKPAGVEDPPQPFNIQDPGFQVKQDTSGTVIASWNVQDPNRITYKLERSTDKSNWEVLYQGNGGTYPDSGPYQELQSTGSNNSKTYFYKLTVIDTQGGSEEFIRSIVVKSDPGGDNGPGNKDKLKEECKKPENQDKPECEPYITPPSDPKCNPFLDPECENKEEPPGNNGDGSGTKGRKRF